MAYYYFGVNARKSKALFRGILYVALGFVCLQQGKLRLVVPKTDLVVVSSDADFSPPRTLAMDPSLRPAAAAAAVLPAASGSRKGFAHCVNKKNATTHQQLQQDEDNDPCAAPQSLTAFLQQQTPTTTASEKFSRQHPVCPQAARHRIHVAIPFYKLDEVTLQTAIQAALVGQRYPRELVHVWLYDDGSPSATTDADTDRSVLNRVCDIGCGTDNVFDFVPHDNDNSDHPSNDRIHASRVVTNLGLTPDDMPPLLCFRSTLHLGPGGGKYWLFRLLQALAGPNDVVLVNDGDDQLLPGALQVVNQHYIQHSAWFTYGSYEGKWSEQTHPLPEDVQKGQAPFTPRTDTWRYGHPRTFKAHLIDHLERIDFTHSNGKWLTKASDRGYVYRMLELAGAPRVRYIPQKIYQYNYSPTTSTLATAQRGKVTKQMTATSARMRLLQHQSLANWVLAQRTILHLSQLLEIIATGGQLQPTYSRDEPSDSRGALVDKEV